VSITIASNKATIIKAKGNPESANNNLGTTISKTPGIDIELRKKTA